MSTQAHTTRLATSQRTADSRRDVPTPTIEPVIVCVVDTGMPAADVANSVSAPALSAHTPPTGWSRVIFDPIVFTMRQPPVSVPSAMAVCALRTTQIGTSSFGRQRGLPAIRSAKMMPMVFWASLAPWPRLYAAADTSWP